MISRAVDGEYIISVLDEENGAAASVDEVGKVLAIGSGVKGDICVCAEGFDCPRYYFTLNFIVSSIILSISRHVPNDMLEIIVITHWKDCVKEY